MHCCDKMRFNWYFQAKPQVSGAIRILSAPLLCTVSNPNPNDHDLKFIQSDCWWRIRVLKASLFILQEFLLLCLTLPEVNAKSHDAKAHNTQGEKEVERSRIITGRTGVNNSAWDEGANEGWSLADDAEQTEEQEFVAAGGDFGDHDLGVTVPGANEKSVEYLVDLYRLDG